MSYTALYRKWRSKTFDEVKGQEPITESFKNQIRTGRIGHAYLFCGTRGTGKTSVAKILARAVNCEHPVNGNPCNECASCKSILNESSMNVVEMDAASNNGVDDIRQIRDQVQYPPVDGRYKVYIIDEVHMLSQAAFNAFLKTLEEPPEYVIFVLATTEPNKIPITILSRCQRYDFRRISTETIAERLREISDSEHIDVSDEALSYIARTGDGSMRDSVSLLDQCAAFQFDRRIEYDDALDILGAVDTEVFSELVRSLAGKDIRKALKLISDMIEQGREISQFVGDFILYIRNMLLQATVDNIIGLVDMSKENLKRLKEDSKLLSIDELMRYIRILSELSNQMRYSSQKRILVEITLMKLAYPETDVSMEGVNARIQDIRKNMSSFGSAASMMASSNEESDIPQEPRGPKTVHLPRGQYEDFMMLRNEWKNIIASIEDSSLRVALQNTHVVPNRTRTGMTIVSESRNSVNLLSGEELMDQFRKLIGKRYKKDIPFSVELSHESENSTIYVTDDDLKVIKTDVEMTDNI